MNPIMTVGIDVPSSQWAAATAAREEDIHAAVAIHPNASGGGLPNADYDEIARLAALPQVRAVGETGLDHYRTGPAGTRRRRRRSGATSPSPRTRARRW